jgi:L-ascorbate 6-phosphate lactonase
MLTGEALIDDINSTELAKGHMAFWWIGQIGFIYKLAGRVIYIDAYLVDSVSRMRSPVLSGEQVTNADIVMGTHDHTDHIDHEAWKAIAKASPGAVFVCPAMHVQRLADELGIPPSQFCGIEDGEVKVVKGIAIRGIADAHELLDQDPATGAFPYMGYILQADGVSFYHAGDTCKYEGLETKLKSYGTQDVIFVPINGRDSYRYTHNCIGNMTFQEAVDLTGAIRPRSAVPAHYEMHAINMENPQKYEHYLKAKYPGIPCWIGAYGEKVIVKGGKGILPD